MKKQLIIASVALLFACNIHPSAAQRRAAFQAQLKKEQAGGSSSSTVVVNRGGNSSSGGAASSGSAPTMAQLQAEIANNPAGVAKAAMQALQSLGLNTSSAEASPVAAAYIAG